jgi:hypothetical protein
MLTDGWQLVSIGSNHGDFSNLAQTTKVIHGQRNDSNLLSRSVVVPHQWLTPMLPTFLSEVEDVPFTNPVVYSPVPIIKTLILLSDVIFFGTTN